jgi:hypothetical protein
MNKSYSSLKTYAYVVTSCVIYSYIYVDVTYGNSSIVAYM